MCGYCPKRSQNLDRIKRHHAHAHSEKECVWQELSRDQVVSIITSDQYAGKGDNDYKCFYCQVTIWFKGIGNEQGNKHCFFCFRLAVDSQTVSSPFPNTFKWSTLKTELRELPYTYDLRALKLSSESEFIIIESIFSACIIGNCQSESP